MEEIHEIVKSFGKGAYNAKRAGFDGVEIHAVHEGYLMDQFAISFFNDRTDEYGGCLENRLRFAKEVREEIAATCGWDFPVTMRYSSKSMLKGWREGALPDEEFEEKGRDLVETAKLLEQYGYDALDVDVGCYDAWWWNHPPMYQEKGLYRKYGKQIAGMLKLAMQDVEAGSFGNKTIYGSFENGCLSVGAFNDDLVPADVQTAYQGFIDQMVAGAFPG